jgi:hypothetical protein
VTAALGAAFWHHRAVSPSRKRKRSGAPARRRAAAVRTATSRRRKASAPARRADFGAPIDGFLARQPPHLRAILIELRRMIETAAPEATASIKWGIPFFSIEREMMCALGAHREHVNLVLPGPEGTYDDPGGRLEGESRNGKHLELRSLDELPRDAVRGWIRTAAARARGRD